MKLASHAGNPTNYASIMLDTFYIDPYYAGIIAISLFTCIGTVSFWNYQTYNYWNVLWILAQPPVEFYNLPTGAEESSQFRAFLLSGMEKLRP